MSAFTKGLLFRNVDVRAAIIPVPFGTGFYAMLSFVWKLFGLHYSHLMVIKLFATICVGLIVNRVVFGKIASWVTLWNKENKASLLIERAEIKIGKK